MMSDYLGLVMSLGECKMHTEKTCSLASTKPSTETTEKNTNIPPQLEAQAAGNPLMCIECGVGLEKLTPSVRTYHGLQYQIKENIKYGKIT